MFTLPPGRWWALIVTIESDAFTKGACAVAAGTPAGRCVFRMLSTLSFWLANFTGSWVNEEVTSLPPGGLAWGWLTRLGEFVSKPSFPTRGPPPEETSLQEHKTPS